MYRHCQCTAGPGSRLLTAVPHLAVLGGGTPGAGRRVRVGDGLEVDDPHLLRLPDAV